MAFDRKDVGVAVTTIVCMIVFSFAACNSDKNKKSRNELRGGRYARPYGLVNEYQPAPIPDANQPARENTGNQNIGDGKARDFEYRLRIDEMEMQAREMEANREEAYRQRMWAIERDKLRSDLETRQGTAAYAAKQLQDENSRLGQDLKEQKKIYKDFLNKNKDWIKIARQVELLENSPDASAEDLDRAKELKKKAQENLALHGAVGAKFWESGKSIDVDAVDMTVPTHFLVRVSFFEGKDTDLISKLKSMSNGTFYSNEESATIDGKKVSNVDIVLLTRGEDLESIKTIGYKPMAAAAWDITGKQIRTRAELQIGLSNGSKKFFNVTGSDTRSMPFSTKISSHLLNSDGTVWVGGIRDFVPTPLRACFNLDNRAKPHNWGVTTKNTVKDLLGMRSTGLKEGSEDVVVGQDTITKQIDPEKCVEKLVERLSTKDRADLRELLGRSSVDQENTVSISSLMVKLSFVAMVDDNDSDGPSIQDGTIAIPLAPQAKEMLIVPLDDVASVFQSKL